MKKFLAGAAKSNASPALGVSLNGGFQDRTATYIHDELHARCLVLDDGDKRIALAVCDACMIPTDLCEAAKHLAHEHTDLPIDRILISATHTHTAPTLAGVFQSEPDEEYRAFLALRIADGIRRAIHNLEPAHVAWGTTDESTQVFNRRWKMKAGTIPANPFGVSESVRMNPPAGSADLLEPAGPIDPQISVVAVVGADRRPLALLANYSLHYVGDVGAGHVSADYFAAFADRLQQMLGADRLDPPFVGIMSNGTSGNINNINFREASARGNPPYTQIRRVANIVAERVHELYQRLEFRDAVSLDTREQRLKLGRRLPTADETARARFILSRSQGPVLTTAEQIYARETVLMEKLPPTEELILQALRIGDVGVAAIPCETFVETGLAIKQESPLKPTFTISLANGYAGYLPTPEHHRLGGYETWRARSSFLAVDAEPQIRAAVLGLLKQMA